MGIGCIGWLTGCPPEDPPTPLPPATDAAVDAGGRVDSGSRTDAVRFDAFVRDNAAPADVTGQDTNGLDAGPGVDASALDRPRRDTDYGEISVAVRELPQQGRVRGLVIDVESNTPVNGALVTIGATSTVTHEDGAFWLEAPAGPLSATVTLDHYLPWHGRLLASDDPVLHTVSLHSKAPDAWVDSVGGVLQTGDAFIEVPANAFPSLTSASATWIAADHIAAVNGPLVFHDGTDGRQLIGVLAVDVLSEPVLPVTLRLPVPTDVTPTELHLFTLDEANRTWGNPIAPSLVAGGYATFEVSSFSSKGLARRSHGAYFVSSLLGRVSLGVPTQRYLRPFDYLDTGDVIRTERGSWVELQTTYGSNQIYIFPQTQVTIGQSWRWPNGGDGHLMTLDSAGKVYVDVMARYPGSTDTCFHVTDRATGVQVKAPCDGFSVFRLQRLECPESGPYTQLIVENDRVIASYLGQDTTYSRQPVTGPMGTFYCGNCSLLPAGQAPSCCDVHNCPDGCCTEDGQCAAGDQRNQCGTGGQLCKRCGVHECGGSFPRGICGSRCLSHGECGSGKTCNDGQCVDCQAPAPQCSGSPCSPEGGQCMEFNCGQGCYIYQGQSEQCGDGFDNDRDGRVDEDGLIYGNWQTDAARQRVTRHDCVACTVDDDCPDLAFMGTTGAGIPHRQFCDSDASYCFPCPPQGCWPCVNDSECGQLEMCLGGICQPCPHECAAGTVWCRSGSCGGQCQEWPCSCSAEFGNGCTVKFPMTP